MNGENDTFFTALFGHVTCISPTTTVRIVRTSVCMISRFDEIECFPNDLPQGRDSLFCIRWRRSAWPPTRLHDPGSSCTWQNLCIPRVKACQTDANAFERRAWHVSTTESRRPQFLKRLRKNILNSPKQAHKYLKVFLELKPM